MENLFKKLVSFFNELNSNNSLEIHKETHFPQDIDMSNRILEKYQLKILEESGIEFNNDEIKLLGLTSLSIKWKNKSLNSYGNIYGGTSFSIYGGLCSSQNEWLKENPLNHPQELVDNLYHFNNSEIELHTPQNGRGCFYRAYGKWPLDIYFFDNGVRIKMDMYLEDYIQALIDSCAVGYWQYFYVDIDELIKQNREMRLRDGSFFNRPPKGRNLDDPRLKYLLYELEIFVANLPILFPEKDFSYHQNRLSQIKEKAQPYL